MTSTIETPIAGPAGARLRLRRSAWPSSSRGAAIALVPLMALLVWSRCTALGQSFWADEAYSVIHFSGRGPRAVLWGDYTINNHLLFNLLSWFTAAVLAHTETVYRLWSVVPGLAAVGVTGAWLWRRVHPWAAVGAVMLIALSPTHDDLTRQARGYGLVFLATSVLLAAGDWFLRTGASRALVIWAAGGLVGILTFPLFVMPFAAASAVVFAGSSRRRAVALAVGIVGLIAVGVYAYALHTMIDVGGDFRDHRRLSPPALSACITWLGEYVNGILGQAGRYTDFRAEVLRPLGTALVIYPLQAFGAVQMWRRGRRWLLALLLVPGTSTMLVASLAHIALAQRYTGYLVFPAVALVVSGAAYLVEAARSSATARRLVTAVVVLLAVPGVSATTGRWAACALGGAALAVMARTAVASRSPGGRTGALCAVAIAVALTPLVLGFVRYATTLIERPRENLLEAGRIAWSLRPDLLVVSSDVYGVRYYLGKPDYALHPNADAPVIRNGDLPVPLIDKTDVASLLCSTKRSFAFVVWDYDRAEIPTCLIERGVLRSTFRQRSRGERVEIWTLSRHLLERPRKEPS